MTSSPKRQPVPRILLFIAQPRVTRVILFATYLVLAYGGVNALIDPPASIETTLGSALMTSLGLFIVVGAGMAALAVLPGVWWLERAGVVGLAVGTMIYASVVFSIQLTEAGRGLQISFITAMLLCLLLRWMGIRGAALDPRT